MNRKRDPKTGLFLPKNAPAETETQASPALLNERDARIAEAMNPDMDPRDAHVVYARAVMAATPDPRLPRRYTDEGIAEARQKAIDEGRPLPTPGLQVGESEHDKAIQARVDANNDKLPEWEAPEPDVDLVDRFRKPGFRYRLLSPGVIEKRGLRRWNPVIDPETGSPAKYGAMILGEMPEDLAKARDRHMQQKAAAELQDIEDAQTEQIERLGGADAVVRKGEKVSGPAYRQDDGVVVSDFNQEVVTGIETGAPGTANMDQ